MSELGKKGGSARAKALTAKQRKESATKASNAASQARKRKAYRKHMDALIHELKVGTTRLLKKSRAAQARLAKKKRERKKKEKL